MEPGGSTPLGGAPHADNKLGTSDEGGNLEPSTDVQDASSWEVPLPEPFDNDDWDALGIQAPSSPRGEACNELEVPPTGDFRSSHPWDNLLGDDYVDEETTVVQLEQFRGFVVFFFAGQP